MDVSATDPMFVPRDQNSHRLSMSTRLLLRLLYVLAGLALAMVALACGFTLGIFALFACEGSDTSEPPPPNSLAHDLCGWPATVAFWSCVPLAVAAPAIGGLWLSSIERARWRSASWARRGRSPPLRLPRRAFRGRLDLDPAVHDRPARRGLVGAPRRAALQLSQRQRASSSTSSRGSGQKRSAAASGAAHQRKSSCSSFSTGSQARAASTRKQSTTTCSTPGA